MRIWKVGGGNISFPFLGSPAYFPYAHAHMRLARLTNVAVVVIYLQHSRCTLFLPSSCRADTFSEMNTCYKPPTHQYTIVGLTITHHQNHQNYHYLHGNINIYRMWCESCCLLTFPHCRQWCFRSRNVNFLLQSLS